MKKTVLCIVSALILILPNFAMGQEKKSVHGLSLTGELKYPEGFSKFEYVNANAPKDGVLRLSVEGAFDSLNPVSPRGVYAPNVNLIYDTLMKKSYDEVSSEYGLIAKSVSVPNDISSATFQLRQEAKWHDGTSITADDVIFSFYAWKKSSTFTAYYANVIKAEKIGANDVKFTFDAPNNKELPQILGQLIVLPKAYWSNKDSSGNPRDISAPTLEIPMGSGPYKIKSVEPGRAIAYERVKNYWGNQLNVNIGYHNFNEIRYVVYRDDTPLIEDFKADRLDVRIENRAKNWATLYDFPAVQDGRVIKATFPTRSFGSMQAFALNLRRMKFQDIRVRSALNFMFDFEQLNRSIFYGAYERCNSFFSGTELASTGLPEGKELEILKSLKNPVPAEIFTSAYSNPIGGDESKQRNNMREALRLFKDAGWTIENKKLVNNKGEVFTIEFVIASPAFEPIVLTYIQSLEKIGIIASVRLVDPTQYVSRVRSRDYDIIVGSWGQSLTPGNEQRGMWGSKAADDENSQNLIGIKNPAIDELIDKIIYAQDRETQIAATKSLDRVLLWNHYVIPQWRIGYERIAYWSRFEYPNPLPLYNTGFPEIWWKK